MTDAGAKLGPQRVLVVDDDPVVRLLASQALAAVGFAVEEAENGERGLAAIDASPPDLVLLDVEMPGMDGYETCAALRQRPAGKDLPVLIATGLTDSDAIDRAFQVGATDFIKKPLDWQILQHRVRFVMRAQGAFGDLRRTLGELRNSQDRLANAQRIARIGHWEWVLGEDEMLWSEETHRMLGVEIRAGASTYAAFLAAVHPDDRDLVEKAMQQAASEAAGWSLDHRIVSTPGSVRVVHQQAEAALDASGAVERITGTIQDITDRRRTEEQIRYLAFYDSLTGLPNRRMLKGYLNRLVERARQRGEVVGLLFLNLDRFKRINDTLGHPIGDELLKAVAKRLATCVRTTDYVGRTATDSTAPVSRIGGDEFAIVLSEIRSAEDAAQVARRVLDVLRTPFSLGGRELVVSTSIGIAVAPADGSKADALLKNADTALDHAKAGGRAIYQFFDASMNERAMRNLTLEGNLRAAIERDELLLHYQPQLSLASGSITGVEALVRWNSPTLGLVSPGEFIPLAEETGLIEPLGEWVLRASCTQARAWEAAGLPPLRMSVNVSSHQVRKPGIVDLVERVLRDSGLDPARLELEITESALIGDEPRVVETLRTLKELGLSLALDDFGTGYSSLSYLVRFPIDTIKIDQSFVRHIGTSRHSDAIIAAVVAMAHRLELLVVAEGVETEEQVAFLLSEDCDILQGYRIGRPAEADAVARRLLRPAKG